MSADQTTWKTHTHTYTQSVSVQTLYHARIATFGNWRQVLSRNLDCAWLNHINEIEWQWNARVSHAPTGGTYAVFVDSCRSISTMCCRKCDVMWLLVPHKQCMQHTWTTACQRRHKWSFHRTTCPFVHSFFCYDAPNKPNVVVTFFNHLLWSLFSIRFQCCTVDFVDKPPIAIILNCVIKEVKPSLSLSSASLAESETVQAKGVIGADEFAFCACQAELEKRATRTTREQQRHWKVKQNPATIVSLSHSIEWTLVLLANRIRSVWSCSVEPFRRHADNRRRSQIGLQRCAHASQTEHVAKSCRGNMVTFSFSTVLLPLSADPMTPFFHSRSLGGLDSCISFPLFGWRLRRSADHGRQYGHGRHIRDGSCPRQGEWFNHAYNSLWLIARTFDPKWKNSQHQCFTTVHKHYTVEEWDRFAVQHPTVLKVCIAKRSESLLSKYWIANHSFHFSQRLCFAQTERGSQCRSERSGYAATQVDFDSSSGNQVRVFGRGERLLAIVRRLCSACARIVSEAHDHCWQCGHRRNGWRTATRRCRHHQSGHWTGICVYDTKEDRCRIPATERRARMCRSSARIEWSRHLGRRMHLSR